MLQQTQATRVVPKYEAFLRHFSTARALAEAPLGDVLRAWQGLGYNRRAKYLHEAAKSVMIYHSGRIPRSYEDLRALPGVGDYTARAVRAFAFNEPEVFIETNIRAVFIHHFFPKKKKVSDKELLPYMVASLDRKNPRRWYSALMDYGSYLKQTMPNPSRRSAHHVRQSKFKGSDREIRGAILKAYLAGTSYAQLPFDKKRITTQLARLGAEGLLPRTL
jgi:A/G-specific adenine glycosylase